MYLGNGIKRGGESSVGAKELLVNGGSKRQEIKKVCEALPHVRAAVLSHALVVKTIHLRDLARFMVPAQDCHPAA